MKRKKIYILALALVLAVPAYAVFNEKNLAQTISVLRYELQQECNKMESAKGALSMRNRSQHSHITDVIKKCNELSLILYSQNQDFTFDMTYALSEVTDEYNAFNKSKMPYEDMVRYMDLEIEKYENLIRSLKRIPPIIKDVTDSLAVYSISDSLKTMMKENGMMTSSKSKKSSKLPKPVLDSLTKSNLFYLDDQGQDDRDSCLFYAKQLLSMYKTSKVMIMMDNEHYDNASDRLKESYDYAQSRYRDIQRNIFIKGQDNYFKVLSSLSSYSKMAFREAKMKYSTAFQMDESNVVSKSEWRGPMVVGFVFVVIFYILIATLLSILVINLLKKTVKALQTDQFQMKKKCFTLLCGFILFAITIMVASAFMNQNFFKVASGLLLTFAWLVAAILASLYIRLKGEHISHGMRLYTPIIVMGLLVIMLRIVFVPNNLINLFFPPLLLIFFFWQLRLCLDEGKKVERGDLVYSWITLIIFAGTGIVSLCGYVLLSVQLLIWWLIQFAAIETITAVADLLELYRRNVLAKKLSKRKSSRMIGQRSRNSGDNIQVTWLFDLIKMMIVPIVGILSVPACIWLASNVFDLTEICRSIFKHPFFNLTDANGSEILHLSLYKLVIVSSLFFVFKYIAYALKAFYRQFKLETIRQQSGQGFVHANQLNLTLANNVVSIIVWGVYLAIAIILMKIPMGALSIVAAGLATGIGLALKDVLNNFIYGIQLMSGRLRVGDYIECDGIRGKVDSISYQSTHLETIDGAIMAFTNTTLFNKNFKNLTRNNSYEFVKIVVGVNYGADIQRIRDILLPEMQKLRTKDPFGREIVDPDKEISVSFNDFGDSSVNLAVKQYVLVEEKTSYVANAQELIYNILTANGIEIPFPQRDVSVRITREG